MLQGTRQDLFESLLVVLAAEPMKGIIIALAMGERQGIDSEQWRALTRTGTSHLVAISGLHIGLAAGGCYWVALFVWSRLGRLPLWLPAQQTAALAGLIGAFAYAALAGFSLPTQRALIMVGIGMAGIMSRNGYGAGQTLALALLVVLIYDPLSVMSPGFWLSFGAVAAILISVRHRTRSTALWWRWGRIHVLLAIGLTPILAYFFQIVPTYAPLANLFAVPWVAFVVVPLTLSGVIGLALWPPLGVVTLHLAAKAMAALWLALTTVATAPGAQWSLAVASSWALIPAIIAILLILLPRGLPGRTVSLILLIPLMLHRPERPEIGAFRLDLLDVGQGLSAVVRTRNHVLIYDTGPRFGSDFDAGQAAIVPYLRHEGIERIDTLVISHGDRDHIGGFDSLNEAMAIDRIVTGIDGTLDGHDARHCDKGERWQWDGVTFAFLHPAPDFAGGENDRSCVLKVGDPGHGLLLPGDIEAGAESDLVHRGSGQLQARVLIAPHHGSKTSSTLGFLKAVEPELVLFPVGYRNRFGFPRPSVRERYRRLGIAQYDTARQGAIRVDFSPMGEIAQVLSFRNEIRRYWHWRTYFNDPDEGSMMGR